MSCDRQLRVGEPPCSSRGKRARPAARRARGPRSSPWRATSRSRSAVVPRARERDDLALELAAVERRAGRPGAWTVKWMLHAVALAEHHVGVDGVGVRSARGSSVEQALAQLARRSARAAARRSARRCAPSGSRRPSSRTCSPCSASSATTARAQVVGRGGEQLVLRERVEQRDGGLVVVRALDQVLGRRIWRSLRCSSGVWLGGLGVGLGGEQAEHPRLADDLARRAEIRAHADVVHAHAPVHGREPVGLGDDQQVALERALAHVGAAATSSGTGSAYVEPRRRRRGSRGPSRARPRSRPSVEARTRGSRGR